MIMQKVNIKLVLKKLFEVFTEIASVTYNVDRLSGVENFEEFFMQLMLMIDELI